MHFRLASAVGIPNSDAMLIDKLSEEMNEMKIKYEKEMKAAVVDGNGTETGHIIVQTIGAKTGQPKQIFRALAYELGFVTGISSLRIYWLIFTSMRSNCVTFVSVCIKISIKMGAPVWGSCLGFWWFPAA